MYPEGCYIWNLQTASLRVIQYSSSLWTGAGWLTSNWPLYFYSHFAQSTQESTGRTALLRPPFCHLLISVFHLNWPGILNTSSNSSLTPFIFSSLVHSTCMTPHHLEIQKTKLLHAPRTGPCCLLGLHSSCCLFQPSHNYSSYDARSHTWTCFWGFHCPEHPFFVPLFLQCPRVAGQFPHPNPGVAETVEKISTCAMLDLSPDTWRGAADP